MTTTPTNLSRSPTPPIGSEDQMAPEELTRVGARLIKERRFEDAIRYLRPAAKKENALALYYLGACNLNGDGVAKDMKAAFSYFHASAERGYPAAIYEEGLCLLNGDGVNRNREEAMRKFFIAAERGHKEAQFLSAFLSYQTNPGCIDDAKKQKIFQNFLLLANQDHSDAEFFVAKCCESGFGIEKNPTMAREYFSRSAGHKHLNALLCLMCEGQATPEIDLQKALPYFYKKEQEEKNAFGWSYRELMGTFSSEKEAFLHYQQETTKGPENCFRLGLCFFMGIGVEKSPKDAFDNFSIARLVIPGAQLYLALCYANGVGTEKSEKQATKYLIAAKQLPAAQFYLGVGCFSRLFYHLKQEKAIEHYTKAADQRFAIAQHNLAICLYNGIGIEKNEEKALALLRDAASGGCVESQEYLRLLSERKSGQPSSPKAESSMPQRKEEAPGSQLSAPSATTKPIPKEEDLPKEVLKDPQAVSEKKILEPPKTKKEELSEENPLIQQGDVPASKCCCTLL